MTYCQGRGNPATLQRSMIDLSTGFEVVVFDCPRCVAEFRKSDLVMGDSPGPIHSVIPRHVAIGVRNGVRFVRG
jgi:hypothetical protein